MECVQGKKRAGNEGAEPEGWGCGTCFEDPLMPRRYGTIYASKNGGGSTDGDIERVLRVLHEPVLPRFATLPRFR